MRFELRSNGKIEIELIPETAIECAFVHAFLTSADKGTIAKISDPGPDDKPVRLVVSIEA